MKSKCHLNSWVMPLAMLGNIPAEAAVIFTESFGTVAEITPIAAHESANGFDNDAFTFSGTGDLRNTTTSSGYTGASGVANLYLTTTGTPSVKIVGISTIGYTAGTIGISFGAHKAAIASDMTTLVFEYSTDDSVWTQIGIPAQATGSGTTGWREVSMSNTSIPISSTLSLRWTNSDSTSAFRIDDVTLSGIPEPGTEALGAFGLAVVLGRRRRAGGA